MVNGTPVVVTGKDVPVNVTVVVDGKAYSGVVVNGTVSVVTGRDESVNVTVVVDGKAYSGVVVNGTVSVVTDKEDIGNITVIVDGKMYPAEVVDGKVVIDTNVSQRVKTPINVSVPENIKSGESSSVDVTISGATGNVSVIVDGKETVVSLVNGSASVLLDNLSEGIHGVVVVYCGDETHAPVHSASSFKVDEIPVVLPIASEFSEISIGDNQIISIVLKDAEGQVITNAPIIYSVNGVINNTVADVDGKFTIKGENGAVIFINYEGNAFIIGTNTTLTLNNPVPIALKVTSHFNVSGSVITIKGYAVDTKAGEEGIYYSTELLDVNGNPIKGVEIQLALNDNIYKRTTDENGSFEPYKLNMASAGKYTMVLFFAGDEKYTGALATVCFDLSKKSIKIKASSKTFKVNKKVKYTITLSTIVGSSHDGKTHLRTGKVAKLTVNGKTYTAKTNKNGKITFNIKNTKKGRFTASITVNQDSTYAKATKKVKLTFK